MLLNKLDLYKFVNKALHFQILSILWNELMLLNNRIL